MRGGEEERTVEIVERERRTARRKIRHTTCMQALNFASEFPSWNYNFATSEEYVVMRHIGHIGTRGGEARIGVRARSALRPCEVRSGNLT